LVPGDLNSEELPKTSSRPSDEPEDRIELFHDVLQLLENSRIPYAVSGAFSLRQHTGICRYTKDLDLFLTAENSVAALSCLRAADMDCEVADPVWLSKAWRDGYFVDLITGMSNGLITVEESWIQRARPAVVYGVETRVLAPEELVASKIFVAKRERFDGADIAHVIYGTYGEFDWKRELEIVGPHWEMLLWSLLLFRYVYPAQSHYVPSEIWCELLTRFMHEVKNPNVHALFRGSLIDENMFAIDVNEWELPNLLEEARRLRLERIGHDQAPIRKPTRKRA
jgi:hypothetical protein